MPKDYPNGTLLATPAELATRIDAGEPLLVLDVRAADAFANGHIAHAIHVDLWGVSLVDTDPAPLEAFMWMIDHVLNLRGVNADVPIVVYSDQSDVKAARVFWFLEYFGHTRVQILDGGFAAWTRAGLPVTQHADAPPKTDWSGVRQESRIATWRDVQARIGSKGAVLLDTRSDPEYYGTLVRAKRGGAIPGAVHIEWTNNLDKSGEYKTAPELRTMYETAGVTPDKEIVTYCQGGYRAAHSYVALRLLGYPHVRNYTGSWKEWGDREDLPIDHPRKEP